MDLKQIRYFCAVADAGSFSAGARRAFVTQPTLSAAIASLEAELEVRLFDRRARGTVLTAAGQRVLAHARAVLRESERLRAAALPAAPAPPRTLGLLASLPAGLVAATLSALRAAAPGQLWRTEDAGADRLRQRLASGRYDAILTRLEPPAPGHVQKRLAGDRLALAFAAADRPAAPVTPAILHGRPLIVRTHCEFLQAASRLLDDWQVRPQVVARTGDDGRALAMVAAGLGACLMPDSLHRDGVVHVRPEGVDLVRQLGLEWIGPVPPTGIAELPEDGLQQALAAPAAAG